MKQLLSSLLVGIAIGAAFIWYAYPRTEVQVKTETKIVTEYKTKVVERWRKNPDGSEERERTEETSGSSDSTKITDRKINKSQWNLNVSAGAKLSDFTPIYGLQVGRRIVGPVFAGVYGRTDEELGLTIGLEF
jgi:hypothetical protein